VAWSAPATFIVGQVLTAAQMNAITANLSVLGGTAGPTYTSYTPSWSSTGTAPAIGNATITAQYAQIAKSVHAFGSIAFGGTSTFGTGTYAFTLPVTPSSAAQAAPLGMVHLYDSSASAMIIGFATSSGGGSAFTCTYGATYGGVLTNAGQLVPWTWASGDLVQFNLLYATS